MTQEIPDRHVSISTFYKILTPQEYDALNAFDDNWTGSELDKADGFIHLSTWAQVPTVADLFFSQCEEIVLLSFPYELVETRVRWENAAPPPKGGGEVASDGRAVQKEGEVELYPHLYGGMDLASAGLSWERVSRGPAGFKEVLKFLKP
ncbi:hypothetical protein BC832DRAFT_21615 [Gaertneriomyces semiglobifer]|nr:hypothetical protein BC832DRAFT_21615 [Gaertneriomyces semiglobifer]